LTNAIGILVAQCTIDNDWYKLGSSIKKHIIIPYVTPITTNFTNAKLWHHRMGCINERRMQLQNMSSCLGAFDVKKFHMHNRQITSTILSQGWRK
jgi:hypothetical protein